MTNLLEETKIYLKDKDLDEVWVSINNTYWTWKEFEAIAKDINYDEGYGSEEINPDLKIVGKNWWLERAEYDGSEWWEYKTQPKLPTKIGTEQNLKRAITNRYWKTK